MRRRSSKERDFAVTARAIVEQAIGEHFDGTPFQEDTRNPHAVALGRLGGKKGGKVRAKKLSRKRRKQIAKLAAAARWESK